MRFTSLLLGSLALVSGSFAAPASKGDVSIASRQSSNAGYFAIVRKLLHPLSSFGSYRDWFC